MFLCLPRRFLALALVAGGACAGAAHAQSSYVMTTLKPAVSSKPLTAWGGAWEIDQAGRVVADATWLTGYGFSPTALAFGPVYGTFAARWPASTAASVSPAKLFPNANGVAALSPDGQKLVLVNGPVLYDTVAKRTLGSMAPKSPAIHSVNNAGVVTTESGTYVGVGDANALPAATVLVSHGFTWSPTQGYKALAEGSNLGSVAHAINSTNVMAGAVTVGGQPFAHQAALWVGGALKVLPQAADTVSVAFQINDKGQALIRRGAMAACSVFQGYRRCQVPATAVFLRSDTGAETALLAPGGERSVATARLNNVGVVVGRYIVGASPGEPQLTPVAWGALATATDRAFIWQDGVFSDLTAWVTSKGLALPAGAVLIDALAINDKGSIVAQLQAADKTTSFVRLTAKP